MKRTKSNSDLIILTMDPSLSAWGFAVLDGSGHILQAECIKTESEAKKRRIRKGDDRVRRIGEINQQLLDIVGKYEVNYLLCELPHGSQTASAAVMIGVVSGIVQTFSDVLNIPVEWYYEGDAKKALLNRASGTKQEVIDRIECLYNVPWTKAQFRNEAIADALAIHHAATKQSQFLKFYKNKKR